MDEEKIREIILKRMVEGKLYCEEACKISKEYGIPLSLIGRICNQGEPKIKIAGCMLGCF